MRYAMTGHCQQSTRGHNPAQVFFFVMNSRGKHAVATYAHVSKPDAEREARAQGGCVRVGHVETFTVDGVEFTVAETV